jgi:ABC-type multidrug transport system fused ATPase/permease subunit
MPIEEKKVTRERLKIASNTIFSYLKTFKKETILLSILAVVSAIGNGTIPYITGRFFDSIIKPGSAFTILSFAIPIFIVLLVVWLIIQIVTSLVDWKISSSSLVISQIIWSEYMSQGIRKILLLPTSFHKENNSSSLLHKLDMAGSSINKIFTDIIIRLTPKFLSIFVSLIICFYINTLLFIILVIGLIVFSVVMFFSIKPLSYFQREFWNKIHDTWSDFSGILDNTKTIKQSTTEEYEYKRLDKIFKEWLLPSFIKLWSIKINLWSYQRFIILFTQFFIFCFSLAIVFRNQMSVGDLLAFNAYTALVFGPLVELGTNWQDVVGGIVEISETEKVLSAPSENYQPKDFIKLDKIDGNISFKNVDFHYDKKTPVLKDISFEVKGGEVVALVGESGVGKSTLIDIISGYHFPTTGNVMIDNVPVEKVDLNFLRKNIAIVPQEVVLFNDTIRKNVAYGNFDVSLNVLASIAEKTGMTDFIEKLPQKWESIVGERGIKLSVGQKQRVSIARAMLRNPKILILDEPTSALDAGSEKIITDSLEELMKGKTTFIIAHRLSTVKRADKILVFKNGQIVENGTHTKLLRIKGGEYRRLYDLQIGLHK